MLSTLFSVSIYFNFHFHFYFILENKLLNDNVGPMTKSTFEVHTEVFILEIIFPGRKPIFSSSSSQVFKLNATMEELRIIIENIKYFMMRLLPLIVITE